MALRKFQPVFCETASGLIVGYEEEEIDEIPPAGLQLLVSSDFLGIREPTDVFGGANVGYLRVPKRHDEVDG